MGVLDTMTPITDLPGHIPQGWGSDKDLPPDYKPGWFEAATAATKASVDGVSFVQEERLRDAYNPVVKELQRRNGKWWLHYQNWTGIRPFSNRFYDDDAIWQDIAAERAKDPTAFADLPATREEFEKGVLTRDGKHQADAFIASKGGFGTNIAGGFVAGFTDPVNISASIMTGGLAKGAPLLRGMLIEGTVNSGVELVQTPFTAAARERIGEETTAGDVALNVASAFAFGAGMHLGGRTASWAYDRYVPLDIRAARALTKADPARLSDYQLGMLLDERLPPWLRTPEQQAAIHIAIRQGEVEGTNPFAWTYEGVDAHKARLAETLAILEEGEKLPLEPPAPSGIAAVPETVAPPAAGAGDGIDAYIAATRRRESSGDPNASSKSSSASGLFGFTDGTWKSTFRKEFPGTTLSDAEILRQKRDPAMQERLMQRLTRENAAWLQRNGFAANPESLYIVHHFGTGDAPKVLRAAGDARMEDILPANVIAANPYLRGQTVAQFRAGVRESMGGAGGEIAGAVETPDLSRPDAMDAVRPTIEAQAVRPDAMESGLADVVRGLVGDRKRSLNDIPGLAGELGVDAGALRGALGKLVDDGTLTLTKSGLFRRKQDRGPEDMLTFIAKRGGLSYDGLSERLRLLNENSSDPVKGHDLKNSGNLDTFVPAAGPLLRPNGKGLDEMGELLWEAGYFGPPETTPRLTEAELITRLDQVILRKEKIYAEGGKASDRATAADFRAPEADPEDVKLEADWQRREHWDRAAEAAGTTILLPHERAAVEKLLESGTDLLPARPGELPSPEELAPYIVEMVNREIDDVLEAAYLETENPGYDFASNSDAGSAEGRQAAGRADGQDGQPGDARPGAAGARAGESAARLDEAEAAGLAGPVTFDETAYNAFDDPAGDGAASVAQSAWHDAKAAVDPNIADRQRQQAQLGAEAPMRAKSEQDGVMGTPLFDAADQPRFDLGDGKGERTLEEIEAELDADDTAIANIKGCLE